MPFRDEAALHRHECGLRPLNTASGGRLDHVLPTRKHAPVVVDPSRAQGREAQPGTERPPPGRRPPPPGRRRRRSVDQMCPPGPAVTRSAGELTERRSDTMPARAGCGPDPMRRSAHRVIGPSSTVNGMAVRTTGVGAVPFHPLGESSLARRRRGGGRAARRRRETTRESRECGPGHASAGGAGACPPPAPASLRRERHHDVPMPGQGTERPPIETATGRDGRPLHGRARGRGEDDGRPGAATQGTIRQ